MKGVGLGLAFVLLAVPWGPPPAPPPMTSVHTAVDLGPSFLEVPDPGNPGGVRFAVSVAGIHARFARDSAVLRPAQTGEPVRVTFPGSRPVPPEGRLAVPHPTHLLLGDDPAAWRTNLRGFREVWYPDLYPGIDLVYRTSPAGLKYDVRVAAHADPGVLRISYEGADWIRIHPDGTLVVGTPAGELRDSRPVGFQGPARVDCTFHEVGDRAVGIACPLRDRDLPLVIDPLVYASFLGGSGRDEVRALAVDPEGAAYLTGLAGSPDFPTTPGAPGDAFRGGFDVFVAKVRADGTELEYATYLGGRDQDEGYGIAVDGSGRAHVTGYTLSPDFPTTPGALDRTFAGGDAFVARISPAGDALEFATFLGGGNFDEGLAIALDPAGGIYVGGETLSGDFPTTPGAAIVSDGGGWDGFLTKLEPSGDRVAYGTYLGGLYFDAVHGVAADGEGRAHVAGLTLSTDFPVTPQALQGVLAGDHDAFALRLSADGSDLEYSTFVGGSGYDDARGIVLDGSGRAHLAGVTRSPDFPTTPGAYATVPPGRADAMYFTVSPGGDALGYSTYYGGFGDDEARSLALHPAQGVVFVGSTDSPDLTGVGGSPDGSLAGPSDGFVAWIGGPEGLTYASYVGGDGFDSVQGVVADLRGTFWIAGTTSGAGFPSTPDAWDPGFNGDVDVFVARVSLDPSPPSLARYLGLVLVALVGVLVPLGFWWVARRRGSARAPPSPPPPSA